MSRSLTKEYVKMSIGLDLNKIHLVARDAVLTGRRILLDYFGRLSKVSEKESAGLVSEADITSEKAITEKLKDAYPEFKVLGEEASFLSGLKSTASYKAGGQWILDPLDGTTNYVHGYYAYSISLGFEWQGELVYGIIDVPALNTTYWAIKGQGAFKDDKRIQVSQCQGLGQALLATGFASSKPKVLHTQLPIFAEIAAKVRGVRRTGSAAYDLCLVAEGAFDGYWEDDLNAWDIAAGGLIVQEANGIVTSFGGKPFDAHKRTIIAASPNVHRDLLKLNIKSVHD
jgi:myo-inositol-1(or 4)-monophosphatase